mmetsp:Transcript_4409/g.11548  ORF Transcript_4409/g.11548 Transcript_4409/m.11548 type:complete len:245 (+) Transcript_4409:1265-1999(+)
MPSEEGAVEQVGGARLDPDDFGLRHHRLHDRRHASQKRRASRDDEDGRKLIIVLPLERCANLLDDLERCRALACDHERVVVGLHEAGIRSRLGQLLRLLLRLSQRRASYDHFCTAALDCVHALSRRALWHDDRRFEAESARRHGDGVPLRADRVGDHLVDITRQLSKLIVRTSQLEGEGRQQVLAFEVHIGLEALAQPAGVLQRCLRYHVVDTARQRQACVIWPGSIRLKLFSITQATGCSRPI